MSDQTRNTKDSVQVCSILHVAHVGVRRATFIIVHYGHQDVALVVKHLRSHFVRELLYREIFYLHLLDIQIRMSSSGYVSVFVWNRE